MSTALFFVVLIQFTILVFTIVWFTPHQQPFVVTQECDLPLEPGAELVMLNTPVRDLEGTLTFDRNKVDIFQFLFTGEMQEWTHSKLIYLPDGNSFTYHWFEATNEKGD